MSNYTDEDRKKFEDAMGNNRFDYTLFPKEQWGDHTYIQPHIESMWVGWCAAIKCLTEPMTSNIDENSDYDDKLCDAVYEFICEYPTVMVRDIWSFRKGYDSRVPSQDLEKIKSIIKDYYKALDARQHGGVASDIALNSIQRALNMQWGDA